MLGIEWHCSCQSPAGNTRDGRDPRLQACDRGQFAATARDFFVATGTIELGIGALLHG